MRTIPPKFKINNNVFINLNIKMQKIMMMNIKPEAK